MTVKKKTEKKKKISQVESFLCPDKQGTPEEGRRIQRPKRSEKNKDEDNSLKTLTDKNHQALSGKFRQLISSYAITFTFGLTPLGKAGTHLFSSDMS